MQHLRVSLLFAFFQTPQLIHPQILLILCLPIYLGFFPVFSIFTVCIIISFNSLLRTAFLPPFLPPAHELQSCFQNVRWVSYTSARTLEWLAFKYNPNHRLWLEWPYMVFYKLISCPSSLALFFQHPSPFSASGLSTDFPVPGPLSFVLHILSFNVRRALVTTLSKVGPHHILNRIFLP